MSEAATMQTVDRKEDKKEETGDPWKRTHAKLPSCDAYDSVAELNLALNAFGRDCALSGGQSAAVILDAGDAAVLFGQGVVQASVAAELGGSYRLRLDLQGLWNARPRSGFVGTLSPVDREALDSPLQRVRSALSKASTLLADAPVSLSAEGMRWASVEPNSLTVNLIALPPGESPRLALHFSGRQVYQVEFQCSVTR